MSSSDETQSRPLRRRQSSPTPSASTSPTTDSPIPANRSSEELRRIWELTDQLSLGEPVDQVMEKIIQSIGDMNPDIRAFIVLQDQGTLRIQPSGVEVGPIEAEDRQKLSRTLVQSVIRRNRTDSWSALDKMAELKDIRSISHLQLGSAVCIPLREHGQAIGALYVDGTGWFDREGDFFHALEIYAYFASVCLTHSAEKKEEEEFRVHLQKQQDLLRQGIEADWAKPMIGDSTAWLAVLTRINLFAKVDYSVLLVGESGTGKELVAQAIHDAGITERQGPFVSINVSAIPENLIESHLFGTIEGAFTDARMSNGFVGQAEGGTLFLDEIGDLPEAAQAKLLRFLEDKSYYRVGESIPRQADVRILSATNYDLNQRVEIGKFRRDLSHRIGHVVIKLPGLAERREDIPALANHFLERSAKKKEVSPLSISPSVLRFLQSRIWPGNVRELRHLMEASEIWARGSGSEVIHLAHLEQVTHITEQEKIDAEDAPIPLKQVLLRTEKSHIEAALHRSKGQILKASRELKTTRQTLYNRMKIHGIDARDFSHKKRK